MSGWNLPPGCTSADIDRHFGGPEAICGCGSTGYWMVTLTCENEIEEGPRAGQVCGTTFVRTFSGAPDEVTCCATCPTCNGDVEFERDAVVCVECGSEMPTTFCFGCHSWLCSCPDPDDRDEYLN